MPFQNVPPPLYFLLNALILGTPACLTSNHHIWAILVFHQEMFQFYKIPRKAELDKPDHIKSQMEWPFIVIEHGYCLRFTPDRGKSKKKERNLRGINVVRDRRSLLRNSKQEAWKVTIDQFKRRVSEKG